MVIDRGVWQSSLSGCLTPCKTALGNPGPEKWLELTASANNVEKTKISVIA